MTRILIVAMSLVLGCGDDDGETRCATPSECPMDFRCINGFCVAPGVDAGPEDAATDIGFDADRVDTSGACGVFCEGGTQRCEIFGFDPDDGLEACTRTCQGAWPEEQSCAGPAAFVLECVDANGSCDTLMDETCSGWLEELRDCAMPL